MTDSYSFGERAYYSAAEVKAIREHSFFRGYVCALAVITFIAISAYVCDIRLTYKGNVCHVDQIGRVSDR